MAVEGQRPAAAKASKTKGKGKGRAQARAAAAASVEDGDSDVDMSGGEKRKKKGGDDELDMVGVLDCVPREAVFVAWPGFAAPAMETAGVTAAAAGGAKGAGTKDSSGSSAASSPSPAPAAASSAAVVVELPPLLKAFSMLLRSLAATEWLAGALTMLTRWAHSRGAQTAAGQQAASRWGTTLVSASGRKVLERLMKLHRYLMMEVGRGGDRPFFFLFFSAPSVRRCGQLAVLALRDQTFG